MQGKSYEESLSLRRSALSPGLTLYYKKPLLIHQGHKQWLWDHTGRRYLDMFAGIVTVSVGHCHPRVTRAAEEQLRSLWHTTNIYMHPKIQEYAEQLVSKLPPQLNVCFFCNSGSEANDLAMMMARLYTGSFDIVSLRNAYHGASPYNMSLCGVGPWKYMFPNSFGVHQAMNPDPYMGPWGGRYCRDSPVQVSDRDCSCGPQGPCQAAENYSQQLWEVLNYTLPRRGIAAFFAESVQRESATEYVQGVGGTVQFPKGYLQKAFEMVRKQGGLCISDEVQTGFGRMGTHYWGFETHDVVPDIVTMAKGMGNGYPIAAVVTRPEIAKTLGEALHFNTFGGNPVACTIGSEVLKDTLYLYLFIFTLGLQVIDEEKLMANSLEVGTHLLRGLDSLKEQFPSLVGDVRGKGLMIGFELVADRVSPLNTNLPLTLARVVNSQV
ncbi:AGXT2 [Cordylochernes scorpioides]|uniref:Alanine--glyoxylate aminotransferase 2, mitochondrial n=1 Tax=Cordylochernes scorpioides TaxID=51811 RepID=A0ABY6JWG2_9ARAC|nr:AGXT2 [Cordylochernes scorpioides]